MQYKPNEAFAGCCAGISGTVIGYPLDVIKTLMQTQGIKSIRVATSTVYKNSGTYGFFRGILSPLISLSILNTVNFSTYNACRRIISPIVKDASYVVPLAGSCVGIVAALISTPFELVKLQAQLSSTLGGSKGAMKIAVTVIRSHGLTALYTGHAVNTSREVIFLSTYFSVYEALKSSLTYYIPEWFGITLSGGLAGSAGWLLSFPLDTVKSNIQGRCLSKSELRSSWQIAKDVVRKRGIRAIYSGIAPSLMRSFLVSSCRFFVFEFVVGSTASEFFE